MLCLLGSKESNRCIHVGLIWLRAQADSHIYSCTCIKFQFQLIDRLSCLIKVDFTLCYERANKSAYWPMWPTRPELIPVSVA